LALIARRTVDVGVIYENIVKELTPGRMLIQKAIEAD